MEWARKTLHVQTRPWSTVPDSQPVRALQRSWPARICQSRNHRNTVAILMISMISLVQCKEAFSARASFEAGPLEAASCSCRQHNHIWSWQHCQPMYFCSSSTGVATVSWTCPMQNLRNCMEKCKLVAFHCTNCTWVSFEHVLQATLRCSWFGLRTAHCLLAPGVPRHPNKSEAPLLPQQLHQLCPPNKPKKSQSHTARKHWTCTWTPAHN